MIIKYKYTGLLLNIKSQTSPTEDTLMTIHPLQNQFGMKKINANSINKYNDDIIFLLHLKNTHGL